MMGTDQIIELALLKSSGDALGGAQKGYGLKKGEMWRYSISSAVIAKQVAKKMSLQNINTIFTSALIKDIGKSILEKHILQFSDKINDLVNNRDMSFQEAEKKVFGIDHAELGAMIAKMWKFSPKMVKIIRHHHLADETMINDKDVTAVYLADCICMMVGAGVGSDGLAYRFKNQAMTKLGMTADDISMIIAQYGIDMQEIDQLLNIL